MTNVLVTGAGGPAGVAVVRALVERGDHVVAVDADPLAAGLRLAAVHAVVCPASNPHRLVGELGAIVKKHSVDLVVSTVCDEMPALAGREHILGAPTWLSPRRSVVACVDKWRFWKIAEHALLPAAATALAEDGIESIVEEIPGPWIVKPRFGRSSRDVYAVDDPAELEWACRRVAEPIVQTRLEGREFTLDMLTDNDGRLAGAVPRWRLETTRRDQHEGQDVLRRAARPGSRSGSSRSSACRARPTSRAS